MQFRYKIKNSCQEKGLFFLLFYQKSRKWSENLLWGFFLAGRWKLKWWPLSEFLTNWGLWKSIYNYCTYFYFNPIMHTYYFRDCLPIFRLAVDFYVQIALYKDSTSLHKHNCTSTYIFVPYLLHKNGSSKYVVITHISTLFFEIFQKGACFWKSAIRSVVYKSYLGGHLGKMYMQVF